MPASDADRPARRPWPVDVAAGIALAQALGTVVFAVLFVVDVLPLEEPRLQRAGFAAGILVLVLAAAAVLGLAARALVAGAGWARSMLVVGQLMALAVGIPMAQGTSWIGWGIAASGAVGLVALLHPATTATLDRVR